MTCLTNLVRNTPNFFLMLMFLFVGNQVSRAQPVNLVKDINQGPGGSKPSVLANVNGILFFDADDGVNGRELWKSDGTAAGTQLVKDIFPGSASSTPFRLANTLI